MPFAVNQGVRIHYETVGQGPPLVMQYGQYFPLDIWYEHRYVDALRSDFQLILVDARGQGDSDKPHDPSAYRMEAMASDILSVLDALGVDKVHYMGYSSGGYLGFVLAKQAQERLLSLILGGAEPYPGPDLDAELVWHADRARLLEQQTTPDFVAGLEEFLSSQRFPNLETTPQLDGDSRMTTNLPNWTATLVHLLALASRLEGEGQYNLAKLARSAADSLSRQAAYQVDVPTAAEALAADIKQTAEALAALDVGAEVVSAMTQGADVMANSGVPLIALIPHPHVCRTCGHLLLGEPAGNCPTCGAWPGTYQRFMPNYWFDALEPPAALARLRQTPLDVAALLEGLSEAQMNQPPAGGGWAIRNALTHLRDAQDVLAFRLGLFLAHEHPVLAAKAVWTWAANEQERPPSALEIFETYQASRADTLDKLAQLPLADWWRTGRHEEFGEVTLRQQVSYFAAHEVTHLSQIGVLRRQWTTA